jgi:hypothetical protein
MQIGKGRRSRKREIGRDEGGRGILRGGRRKRETLGIK